MKWIFLIVRDFLLLDEAQDDAKPGKHSTIHFMKKIVWVPFLVPKDGTHAHLPGFAKKTTTQVQFLFWIDRGNLQKLFR